jgi:lysophospholipase L1-like esterase
MKQEQFEWIHSWSDNTNNIDLPRVLLIGDSITNGYQEIVREMLRGKCYVDYIATSYTLNSPFFYKLIVNYMNNNKYDIIHLNQGLHGFSMSKKTYKEKLRKIISKIPSSSKVILAESTIVNKQGNKTVDKRWGKKLEERNGAVNELVKEMNLSINHLFEVSKNIPNDLRNEDGTHYLYGGYQMLAKEVVSAIEKKLF